jgi:hypothetical protein
MPSGDARKARGATRGAERPPLPIDVCGFLALTTASPQFAKQSGAANPTAVAPEWADARFDLRLPKEPDLGPVRTRDVSLHLVDGVHTPPSVWSA